MAIEVLDPRAAPEALLRELHAAQTDANAEFTPGEPPMPFEQALGYFRHPSSGDRTLWVAREDGEIAGYAQLVVHGPAFTFVEVGVRPAHRRRGVGSALLAELRTAMGAKDVKTGFAHHVTQAGAAFAAKHGARDDQRDVRSILRLAEANLPEPVLPDGVELRSWIGYTPDELLVSHAKAREAMDDAPAPEGVEGFGWSPEKQRENEQATIARNRPARVTVAVADGEVLAFTDLRVSAAPAHTAATDDTATIPSARGRGLAKAVKLESLRRLREDRPDVQVVTTLNAEDNVGMRAVNTKIGFVPAVTYTTTVLTP